MTKQEKNIARLIKSRIHKKDPTAEVILYGSHARGDSGSESDWDILILLNMPEVSRETEKGFFNEILEVELETGEPISTLVKSKNEWETRFSITPFYHEVKKEGIRL